MMECEDAFFHASSLPPPPAVIVPPPPNVVSSSSSSISKLERSTIIPSKELLSLNIGNLSLSLLLLLLLSTSGPVFIRSDDVCIDIGDISFE